MGNNGDPSSSTSHFRSYQQEEEDHEQLLLQQHQQQQQQQHQHQQQQQQFAAALDSTNNNTNTITGHSGGVEGGGGEGEGFAWSIPSMHHIHHHHPHQISSFQNPLFHSLPPLPPPPPTLYGDLYARRASAALQFAYDGGGVGSSSSDPFGLAGLYMGPEALIRAGGLVSSSSSSLPFNIGLHRELGKMTAQEIMDAKALAASKSHSEAERRRRERINAHLAKLRSLLPSTTKTDKASLLAEVIQHVKELKRQMSEIAEESAPLPTESDELSVDAASDDEGKLVVRASLCCDDRSDLLPDLIRTLKALRLRTLKAEITTLGGRVKNVLVVTGDTDVDTDTDIDIDIDSAAAAAPDDDPQPPQLQQSLASIQEALRAVMEHRAASAEETTSAGGGVKRQRTTNLSSILEHRSI